MITISNHGADIVSTNYWTSDHAAQGLCYLSGNAGVLRLLVPDLAEASVLPDLCAARSITIEPSQLVPGGQCVDLVAVDGTDSPFALALDRRQIDRKLKPGVCPLTIWTRLGGRVASLRCEVRV